MGKDNLNQELTRRNILELRKKHGYTQSKVAELIGGSRTIYNGIENGRVKITEYYVQTLADVYHVPFESIAVFASGYDEGFYQGMKAKEKLMQSEFDTQSMSIYQAGKELLSGKKYTSTLYPALKAMGYTLEGVDIEDCDIAKIPTDVVNTADNGKIFVLKKGNKRVGYWSPNDFYQFERFIATAIKGYIKDIADESKKAEQNESDLVITFVDGKKFTYRKKKFVPKGKSPDRSFRVQTEEEKHSADKQLGQLKEDLQTYGIRDSEDNEES